MKRMLFSAALVAAVGLGTVAAFSQANEDDVAARQAKYPLAAKAGEDSHAFDKAPAGALNQGKFDDKTWKFGKAYDAPGGAKIWNPVKLKMMKGGKVTGGTLFSATDPEVYCAMANAGYDFIWSAKNSMRWTPVRWCWWCPRCAPIRKPSWRATGPFFPRWDGVPTAADRPLHSITMCRAAIAPPSTTIWC
jgi:uncharacterized membrane protein